MSDTGLDPRSDGSRAGGDELSLADAEARPQVARAGAGVPTPVILGGFALAGLALFLWLNANRVARQEAAIPEPIAAPAGMPAAGAPRPLDLPAAPPAVGPMIRIPGPQFSTSNVAPTPPPAPVPMATPGAPLVPTDPAQRRRAPSLVVDLGSPNQNAGAMANPALLPAAAPVVASAMSGGAAGMTGQAGQTAQADAVQGISAEERFAERVGTTGETERARATTLRNLDSLVPQGAIIPAVLETAINSDLPGFTRAVVSRDVMSFDGKHVLIPRGSRLVGQYKSGVALGASRIFVIWTRVIRPDGVSVQIGSPGTDALGRGGLGGDVDRHFFQRFGGSILLSVLNSGLTALANSGRDGSQIFIGSPVDANNVATQALEKDGGRPPTIKTPQGAPVRIFVARDLDFSGVAKLP